MSTMQRTITVEHPGAHNATGEAIEAALDAVLKSEGYSRTGDVSVLESVNTSGVDTKLKLSFKGEQTKVPAKKAAAKRTATKTEASSVTPTEQQPVVGQGEVAVEGLPVEDAQV